MVVSVLWVSGGMPGGLRCGCSVWVEAGVYGVASRARWVSTRESKISSVIETVHVVKPWASLI